MAVHKQTNETSNAPICRNCNAGSRHYNITAEWDEVTCKSCLRFKSAPPPVEKQPEQITLTSLENAVLTALFKSSDGNGHDFGFVEDCRSAVGSPRQLSGVIASLVKKGIIWVDGERINNLTQTTWRVSVEEVEALIASLPEAK